MEAFGFLVGAAGFEAATTCTREFRSSEVWDAQLERLFTVEGDKVVEFAEKCAKKLAGRQPRSLEKNA